MATLSPAAAIRCSLSLKPSTRVKSLSPTSSVFFSYNVCNRAGLGLSVGRTRTPRRRLLSCSCLFGLGVPELVVIVGVAALVFGPKKLPEVGRSIGKTVKSFQQAAKEFESELKKDGQNSAEASNEKIQTASEEEKEEATASSTKESS